MVKYVLVWEMHIRLRWLTLGTSCLTHTHLYNVLHRPAGDELSVSPLFTPRCVAYVSCVRFFHPCPPSRHVVQACWVRVVPPLFAWDPSPSWHVIRACWIRIVSPCLHSNGVAQACWVRVIPPQCCVMPRPAGHGSFRLCAVPGLIYMWYAAL